MWVVHRVCKDAGLIEIQREYDEIIVYALNGEDGHTVMKVEYCDCMEDDDTSVTVRVDKFHAIFSGYSYISKSVPRSTAEWLSKEIETARTAIAEADSTKGRKRITLGELRSMLASLSCDQLDNHSDFTLDLGDMTVWEFFEKLTSAQSAIVMHMLNMPKKTSTAKKCQFDGELSWNFIADWVINCISGYTGVSSSVFTADSVYYLLSESLSNMSEAIRLSFGVAVPTTMYSKWSKIKDIVQYIYDSRELLV